jgi:phage terminase large subunit
MFLTEEPAPQTLKMQDLYNLLNQLDATYAVGMDFGFSHCFAYVLAAIVGKRIFVIDAVEIADLELSQRIALCEQKIKPFNPIIFPDTASPADIKTFKRHGFNMRNWNKGKGSLYDGIESLRMKIWPGTNDPEFFILNNEAGNLLAKRLSEYHFKLDSAGRPTETPQEDNDDIIDACRYLVQNTFPLKGKSQIITSTIDASISSPLLTLGEERPQMPSSGNWLQEIIQTKLGNEVPIDTTVTNNNKKSGIIFDI